jgi:AcrR family transcriptional regulator
MTRLSRKTQISRRAASPDERTRRTRQSLAMALIKLGAARPVDDISVGELVGCAGVARSTFYAQFANMGDFLATSYADMLASHVARAEQDTGGADKVLAMGRVLRHVQEANRFVGAIQNSRERPRMLAAGEARLRLIAESNLVRLAPSMPSQDRKAAATFVAGGFMGLLRAWMESGLRDPVEDLEARFEALSKRVVHFD